MTSGHYKDAWVRAAFEDLKAGDARSMPSFTAVLAHRHRRRVDLRSSPVFWIVAAGFAITATRIASRISPSHKPVLTVTHEVAALVAWQPPTDALLPSPTTLIGPRPPLGRSMLTFTFLLRGPIR
jgi:hypothetical protein